MTGPLIYTFKHAEHVTLNNDVTWQLHYNSVSLYKDRPVVSKCFVMQSRKLQSMFPTLGRCESCEFSHNSKRVGLDPPHPPPPCQQLPQKDQDQHQLSIQNTQSFN